MHLALFIRMDDTITSYFFEDENYAVIIEVEKKEGPVDYAGMILRIMGVLGNLRIFQE